MISSWTTGGSAFGRVSIHEHLKWLRRGPPYFAHRAEEGRLRRDLQELGFRCVELDGRQLNSQQGLLARLGVVFGFPHYYGENWDAYEECARDLEGRIALLWLEPEVLLANDYHAFHRGVHMLLSIASDLDAHEDEVAVQMELFLVSERDDFRNGVPCR